MSGQSLSEVLATGVGIERMFLCPVHGDSNPSASVNTLKGVWVCYTCGAHGKVHGEALLGEIDFSALRRQYKKQIEETRTYPESWLNTYDTDHPYWRSRFSQAAIDHYRLGYCFESDAATYPLRANDGVCLGVVKRPFAGRRRYEYPWGADISSLLFDYHRQERSILVLCEGATDAVASFDVDVQATAIYGSRFSVAQAALVRQYDPEGIITAFDLDDAGYGAHRAVEDALREYPVLRLRWNKSKGKDLASLDTAYRKKILLRGLAQF